MSLLRSNTFQENAEIWCLFVTVTIYTLPFTQLENILPHSQLSLDNACVLYRVMLQCKKDNSAVD